MTDLTEKWKKGELPRGWYYVVLDNKETNIAFCKDLFTNCGRKLKRDFAINDITEVLAPVPTYQEYLESEAHCAVYSEENKRLKEDVERYASECAKLRKQGAGTREQLEYKKVENQYLKELLKECYNKFARYQVEGAELTYQENVEICDKISVTIGESEG